MITRRQALASAATTAFLTASESFAMPPKDLILINAKVTWWPPRAMVRTVRTFPASTIVTLVVS